VRVPGAIATQTGERDDLYLVLEVADDARFERKGDNLHTTAALDLYTAILGGEITITTLSGKIMLTIPPGTQPDQVFRISGRGMPHMKDPQTHGDLFVKVKIQIPQRLTQQQKQLFEQLARMQN
jgi:curved DNA-binding protein